MIWRVLILSGLAAAASAPTQAQVLDQLKMKAAGPTIGFKVEKGG